MWYKMCVYVYMWYIKKISTSIWAYVCICSHSLLFSNAFDYLPAFEAFVEKGLVHRLYKLSHRGDTCVV